jgi:hypothetical protein
MANNSKAAQLKDEGNKSFSQKDYVQAFVKYSDAIAEDATNAVLFANRAACSLAMKKCSVYVTPIRWTCSYLLIVSTPDTRKRSTILKRFG